MFLATTIEESKFPPRFSIAHCNMLRLVNFKKHYNPNIGLYLEIYVYKDSVLWFISRGK